MTLSERIAAFRAADLYVVITEDFCAGRSSLEVLDACLAAGVRLVQLREKHLEDRALHELALLWRERCNAAGALFIVDDRVDIALAVGADGVHLGQSDLPFAAARAIAPELLLGISTHNLEEALEAQSAGASYINIGPIFPTGTKDVPTGHVGPAMIGSIRPHLTIPFSCMGGIKEHNLDQVLAQGASIAAVVTAVTAAEDVEGAATALREKILAGG
ncbi:MAG: thiamine phosphate synthase [Candidatus Hydrogenedens sp.]|nr:thiamine phosphate synthase [Candidatus Hydrogenedens sp.]